MTIEGTDPRAEAAPGRGELVKRANELYHDLQSSQFDEIHRRRHRVESVFWTVEVLPRLTQGRARFGVDLCTGTGFVPRILLAGLPEAKVLCVDISPGALARARNELGRLADRAEFFAGDATAVPAPDGSADWVSLNAGLHHVPDPLPVLRKIDRLLKPGGLFCLGHEPNAAFFSCKFLSGMERLIWNAFWYLSPSRNAQRLRRRLRRPADSYEAREHLEAVNAALLAEGLLEAPLTIARLRELVDVGTHADGEHQGRRGFDAPALAMEAFAAYRPVKMVFTDYGGEMLRKHLRLRAAFDRMMVRLAPGKGRLFSWILQKPPLA